MAAVEPLRGRTVVLYDGVCGLCHFFVQYLIRRDPADRLRFVALQDPLSVAVLQRHGLQAAALDSVFVLQRLGEADETLCAEADAILEVLAQLGPLQRLFAWLGRCLPRALRRAAYRAVARRRYRLFGRLASCPLPTPAQRRKFFAS